MNSERGKNSLRLVEIVRVCPDPRDEPQGVE